jgi:hypothetical protein
MMHRSRRAPPVDDLAAERGVVPLGVVLAT